MNKLFITCTRDSKRFPISYKVHDNDTVYMVTTNLKLAEYTFKQLRLEYQREQQNAS
jgi:hypothetical protein